VLKGLDMLLINDTEARMLAGNNNLVQAARAVLALGPRMLVVKHGEYGATASFQQAQLSGKAKAAPKPFARRRCRWKRWSIRPARATALPAASSATSLRSLRADAGRLSPRHVLRQRDGLVRVRALRHRAPAATHPQGDRRPLQDVSAS
jgi:hypothetical protein